jgi:virginiamycin B lyase
VPTRLISNKKLPAVVLPVVGALLLAGAGAGASSGTQMSAQGSKKPRVGTMSELRKERVSAVVKVGDTPDWQAQAPDAIWIANSTKLQRIDPATNRVTNGRASIQRPCAGLTSAFGSVWSEDCFNDALVRVDPRAGREVARIPLLAATDEGLITATSHGVFVVGQNDFSTRFFLADVDPASNKIVARIPLPRGSAAAASGFGSVWVTDPDKGIVSRVDPVRRRVTATVKARPGSRFLAAGEGAVWVLNQADGSVSKIDPRSSRVVATIRANVPGSGGCIATGFGSVWVTMPLTPLLRIDPKANRVIERWTGAGGDCLSTGFGSVWLSNRDFGTVWRINP